MSESKGQQAEDSHNVEDLIALVRQHSDAIQGLRSQLSMQITQEIANSTKKLESSQSLLALVGDIPDSLHARPITPEFALKLVRLIREKTYDLIIEFGSGTSTFLILRALELFCSEKDTGIHDLPHLLSFEHLETHYNGAADLVCCCSNRNQLNLLHSPLSPWHDCTGDYSYYSCLQAITDTLGLLNDSFSNSDACHTLNVLVVIGGPPRSTCRWARYPAGPLVLDACSLMDTAIDFLLEDIPSEEEMEMSLSMMRKMKSPAFTVPLSFIGSFIWGFILSLIIAIFVRKNDPNEEYNSLNS
jgi:hypothetical protein